MRLRRILGISLRFIKICYHIRMLNYWLIFCELHWLVSWRKFILILDFNLHVIRCCRSCIAIEHLIIVFKIIFAFLAFQCSPLASQLNRWHLTLRCDWVLPHYPLNGSLLLRISISYTILPLLSLLSLFTFRVILAWRFFLISLWLLGLFLIVLSWDLLLL